MASVALFQFPSCVAARLFRKFLRLVCALNAGIFFLHLAHFPMHIILDFPDRSVCRVVVQLPVWRLVGLFKVQAGLCPPGGFVKLPCGFNAFLLGYLCPCRFQSVSGFFRFFYILCKLRVAALRFGKLQAGSLFPCGFLRLLCFLFCFSAAFLCPVTLPFGGGTVKGFPGHVFRCIAGKIVCFTVACAGLFPGCLVGFHNAVTGHFLRGLCLCLKLLQGLLPPFCLPVFLRVVAAYIPVEAGLRYLRVLPLPGADGKI